MERVWGKGRQHWQCARQLARQAGWGKRGESVASRRAAATSNMAGGMDRRSEDGMERDLQASRQGGDGAERGSMARRRIGSLGATA
jgi:hypothetical protein